jgi:hypothetical protein
MKFNLLDNNLIKMKVLVTFQKNEIHLKFKGL